MDKPYISSITSRYGDIDKVKEDVKTLNEILKRQGSNLLLDIVAESAGYAAIDFQMTAVDRHNLRSSLLNEFHSALVERT